jgi:hypothetical protein
MRAGFSGDDQEAAMPETYRSSRDVVIRTEAWAEAVAFYQSVMGLPLWPYLQPGASGRRGVTGRNLWPLGLPPTPNVRGTPELR